jgi:hypothetical protein
VETVTFAILFEPERVTSKMASLLVISYVPGIAQDRYIGDIGVVIAPKLTNVVT